MRLMVPPQLQGATLETVAQYATTMLRDPSEFSCSSIVEIFVALSLYLCPSFSGNNDGLFFIADELGKKTAEYVLMFFKRSCVGDPSNFILGVKNLSQYVQIRFLQVRSRDQNNIKRNYKPKSTSFKI